MWLIMGHTYNKTYSPQRIVLASKYNNRDVSSNGTCNSTSNSVVKGCTDSSSDRHADDGTTSVPQAINDSVEAINN